jgi:hypothetical protein
MRHPPRTARLIQLAGSDTALRLTAADRRFLEDLTRVQLISSDLADEHHYAHLKGASGRSLDRLSRAGLITGKRMQRKDGTAIKVYQFADASIAGAFGGKLPVTGARRTDLHELLSSRAYFALGRPETFKLAAHFSRDESALCGSLLPDAMYTDALSGEIVVVEADGGNYNKTQITQKIVRWRAIGLTRQVWAQAREARAAHVPRLPGIEVMRL